MVADGLLALLDTGASESAVRIYLTTNPLIALWSFAWTGGHSEYVLGEFQIGSRYRADLVVPFSYSGQWEVHFVELEPVDDVAITKDDKPSQRLNSAISQIADWADYIEHNRAQVQSDLSNWCVKHDNLKLYKDGEPCNYTGDYLKDPESFIRFKYHIIIGRRARIDKEKRRKMNQYSKRTDIRIATYDRFLDVARNLDQFTLHPDKSVLLTESEERF